MSNFLKSEFCFQSPIETFFFLTYYELTTSGFYLLKVSFNTLANLIPVINNCFSIIGKLFVI